MWIFALPFYIEMEAILQIWLKEIPAGTILFTRLALIEVLINSISLPIATAARAPGRMKRYELLLGGVQLGIFLASWLALKSGSPAYIVFVIAIIANFIMFAIRLLLVRYLIGLSLRAFTTEVVLPVTGVVLLSCIPSFGIQLLLPKSIVFSFVTILVSAFSIIISIYYVGLDKILRDKLKTILLNKITFKNKSN
jgi:hypothetical protein